MYERSTLSPVEQETVLMTASYHNRCHYCMASHSMLMKMKKLPEDVIAALREGRPIRDHKLETLRRFVTLLIDKRAAMSAMPNYRHSSMPATSSVRRSKCLQGLPPSSSPTSPTRWPIPSLTIR
ncbi:carboxymuconolactone decarboxylase family protein [Mesorhizobium sp. A623]